MSGHRPWAEVRRSGGPASEARIAAYVSELRDQTAFSLRELRLARERTQAQVAEAMQMAEPNVSRLERQTETGVATLRAYVEALGGRLELVAVFPDDQYRLRDDNVDASDLVARVHQW